MTTTPPFAPIRAASDTPPLDRAQLNAILGDDPELLQEMVDLFLRDCPALLEAVHQALEAGDARGLERSAHKLKGAVANFAAEPATQAAYEVEQLGRGGDLSAARPAIQLLDQEIQRLAPALTALLP